jgi:hypothetical protein
MLLGLDDDASSGGIPQGSTVFERPSPGQEQPEADKQSKDKTPGPPGSAAAAAAALLQKYVKRPRS